jgi:hypothetical protein
VPLLVAAIGYADSQEPLCAPNPSGGWKPRKNAARQVDRTDELLKKWEDNFNRYPYGSGDNICRKDLDRDQTLQAIAGADGKCDQAKMNEKLQLCVLDYAVDQMHAQRGDRAATNDGVESKAGAALLAAAEEAEDEGERGIGGVPPKVWNVIVSGGTEYCKDMMPKFPRMTLPMNHPNWYAVLDIRKHCLMLRSLIANQKHFCIYVIWGDINRWPSQSGPNWKKRFSKESGKVCSYFSNMKGSGVKRPPSPPRNPNSPINKLKKKYTMKKPAAKPGAKKPVAKKPVASKKPVAKKPVKKRKPPQKKKRKPPPKKKRG